MSARPTRRLARVAFHTLFLEAAFNPERRQGLGAASALVPVAEVWSDPRERRAFYVRHLERFNTNPPFSGVVLGAVARLEEDAAKGDAQAEARLPKLKRALEAPFAAAGDELFWNGLRPAAALAGSALALVAGGWGAILFLALYNLIHLPVRIGGVFRGYALGADVGRLLRAPLLVRGRAAVPLIVPLAAAVLVGVAAFGTDEIGGEGLWALLAAGIGVWGGRTGRLDGARLGGGVIMVGFLLAVLSR